MKRKLAVFLTGLMCITASGCSIGKSGVDIQALNTEDIFTQVDDSASVDVGEAADAFAKALKASEDKENITIKVNNSTVIGTKGEDDYQNSESESVIKYAKDGENKISNVSIDNNYSYANEPASGESSGDVTKESSKITGYYSGDTLYFITGEGDKVKEEMPIEDYKGVISTYSLNVYSECLSKAACIDNNGVKTYYMSYDPAKFENTMNTNMEASGQSLGDGMSQHINYSNIIATVDADGNLLNYGFVINGEYRSDTENLPYVYSIAVECSDIDSTKVSAPKDMDTYMTADEYTQMKQEEAAQAQSQAQDESSEAAEETEAPAEDESK